jgi:hypothetical protein
MRERGMKEIKAKPFYDDYCVRTLLNMTFQKMI